MAGEGDSAALPPVSVIVVSYNHRADLPGCLGSLVSQRYPSLEVIVVDNGSTDGGPEYVREKFPELRLIRTQANLGYAAANNLGFRSASGRLLTVLNPDTEVEPEFVAELVAAFDDPEVGLATPRILHFDERDRINTCGNEVHLSGIGYCRGLDQPSTAYDEAAAVTAISGCAFMVKASLLAELGGFDEDFFLYVEDTDLSIRYRLAGYDIRYVPGAVVYHRYSLAMTPAKLYQIEKNRRLMLVKNLHWRTLAGLLPALWLTSGLIWLYALARGPAYLRAKLAGQLWLWRNWSSALEKRRQVQKQRRRPDSEVVRRLRSGLPFAQLGARSRFLALASAPLEALFGLLSFPARLLAA